MRIAWFRATPPDRGNLLDDTAAVIDALRQHRHEVDVVTASEAHGFVTRHFRLPYDRFVYELGHSPNHSFMHAYLPHYPGIIAPRGLGSVPGSDPGSGPGGDPGSDPGSDPLHRTAMKVAVPDPLRLDVVHRAVDRAHAAGADAMLLPPSSPEAQLRDADVVVALEWPPGTGVPVAALLGMAQQRPVIVLEVEATADWPALDPQTWTPRGFVDDPPIVVSIDPRDEEHSLMLALKRLAGDAPLRARLARAGHAWWRDHATLQHAVGQWEQLLGAGILSRPAHPPPDRSEQARAILAEFGVTVDVLPS